MYVPSAVRTVVLCLLLVVTTLSLALVVPAAAGTVGDEEIAIESASGLEGETVELAVETGAVDVHGYEIEVTYDPAVLNVTAVDGQDLPVDAVEGTNGTVTVTGAETTGIDGPTIATITAELVGEAGATTTIEFGETAVNDDEAYLTLSEYDAGTVEVTQPPHYEKSIENDGGATVIGFPGPVNGTLGDAFPAGYDGISSFFVYSETGWERVSNTDTQLDALEALVVVTDGDGEETIPVVVSLETDTISVNKTLESGWNILPAPSFTDAEELATAANGSVVLDSYTNAVSDDYDEPSSFGSYAAGSVDWGVSPPSVSPFGGYFVYVQADAELEPAVSDVSSRAEADELLGLE